MKLAKRLKAEPSRTTDELAESLGADVEDVTVVLDAYSPSGELVGAGKGGPWLPPQEPEAA